MIVQYPIPHRFGTVKVNVNADHQVLEFKVIKKRTNNRGKEHEVLSLFCYVDNESDDTVDLLFHFLPCGYKVDLHLSTYGAFYGAYQINGDVGLLFERKL